MTLAFYAPLKPPGHPVPSGDRALARNLMALLESGGARVELASDLRSREPEGDAAAQAALMAEARARLPACIDRGRAAGWRGWITYHNYYKAPDLLGPAVTRALGLPYVLIEATRARRLSEWLTKATPGLTRMVSAPQLPPTKRHRSRVPRRVDPPSGRGPPSATNAPPPTFDRMSPRSKRRVR